MRYESHIDADLLDREIAELQSEINSIYEYEEGLKPLKRSGLGATSPNICTNGKTASSLSHKAYLDEFNKGPCTPLIVLAGITGTKLQLTIDCQTLRSNHPDIFTSCKWTTCDPKSSSSVTSVPKSEYTLWVPDMISPFSLTNPSKESSRCFVGLFGMDVIPNSNPVAFKEIKGATVTPMGMTQGSVSQSRCGFEALSNMLPVANILLPSKYKCMEKLRTTLEGMGYRTGLTLQALPYDWRKSMMKNEVYLKLEKLLDMMYSITGKKVSIYAHSFGNINVLNVLNRMSLEKKSRLVKRWFALGAPFMGSPATFSILIGGDNSFSMQGLGITFWMMKLSIANFPSMFDLMPRSTWGMYQNTPWMKSILNRISIERGESPAHQVSPQDDIVSSIYPLGTDVCYGSDWTHRTSKCITSMQEFESLGDINGEKITVSNMRDILQKYSYNPNVARLFDGPTSRKNYDQMTNPGVETVVIYSNILETTKSMSWSSNPKLTTIREDSGYNMANKIQSHMGDGTVLASSTLVPAFKWAYEFQKQQAGAKPVIFAEVCATKNQKGSVYQSGRLVLKNEFQGVSCKCKKGSESGCDHLGITVDSDVIDYIANSLLDAEKPNGSSRYFDSFTEDKVKDFVNRCSLLNDNTF